MVCCDIFWPGPLPGVSRLGLWHGVQDRNLPQGCVVSIFPADSTDSAGTRGPFSDVHPTTLQSFWDHFPFATLYRAQRGSVEAAEPSGQWHVDDCQASRSTALGCAETPLGNAQCFDSLIGWKSPRLDEVYRWEIIELNGSSGKTNENHL